jgi:CheY-like chemotaxis protein
MGGDPITILCVDDNDATRYSVVRVLRTSGYDVVEASTGAEALRLVTAVPDLITLDVHLPDIDGFEVCRRIKADPNTAHVPILHVSASNVQTEHRVRGLRGGADGRVMLPRNRIKLHRTSRLVPTAAFLPRWAESRFTSAVHHCFCSSASC